MDTLRLDQIEPVLMKESHVHEVDQVGEDEQSYSFESCGLHEVDGVCEHFAFV